VYSGWRDTGKKKYFNKQKPVRGREVFKKLKRGEGKGAYSRGTLSKTRKKRCRYRGPSRMEGGKLEISLETKKGAVFNVEGRRKGSGPELDKAKWAGNCRQGKPL